jgi:hypothetical protein
MPGDTGIWGNVLSGVAGAGLQTLILFCGVLGGLFLYRKRREFKPRVRVGMSARISRADDQPPRLFARLHIVNESGGRARVNASAILWSVSIPPNEYPRFADETGDFPLDYARGAVNPTIGVMAGPDGRTVRDLAMEPHECIDTEVLLVVHPLPELMALRAVIDHQRIGRLWPFFWVPNMKENATWASFAYIDPAIITGTEYVALTSHEGAYPGRKMGKLASEVD